MGSIPSLRHEVEELVQIPGAMPRLDAIPPGCAFHPRCALGQARCRESTPPLAEGVACWFTDRATPAGAVPEGDVAKGGALA